MIRLSSILRSGCILALLIPAAVGVQAQQIDAGPAATDAWERSQNQEGYLWRRWQSFSAPDGTPLREHTRSILGTDPYNYTRQHEITLRDGRTISHDLTRSWDGTTGTMERTFSGPNGQTRSFQHAWAPDDVPPTEPPPTALEPPVQEMERLRANRWAGRVDAVGPPAESPGKWGWLEKLNPFRKRSGPAFGTSASRPSPPRRAGFTVGSGGRGGISRVPHGLANRNPGQPSPKSHRPPWAGTPRLRQSPVHSGMTNLRANSGHGGNR